MKDLNNIQPIHFLSDIYKKRKYILDKMFSNKTISNEDFEELKRCPLCNSMIYTSFLEISQKFKYVKCGNCSFIYQKIKLKDSSRLKLYLNSEYFNITSSLQEKTFEMRKYKKFIPILNSLISLIKPNLKNIKVLDIGCASGYFLELLREKTKWNCVGIELNEKSVLFGKQRGLDIICGDFLQWDFKETKFNIITCFGVLGRMTYPVDFLNKCYDLLNQDGILMITTPNCDGFEFSVLGCLHYYFDPIDTIGGFNKINLSHVLERLGFKILSLSTPGNFDLEIIRRHIKVFNCDIHLSPFEKELILEDSEFMEKAREDFIKFLQRYRLSGLMEIIAKKI